MAKKKTRSLEEIQAEIAKTHGERAVVVLGEDADLSIERIPSGIIALDIALGGGYPKGKMVEIFGPEGSGKSSISLRLMAEAQKFGRCVYIDAENSFDPMIAASSGVDLDSLVVSQPESSEQTLEIIEMVLGADDVSAIVVDSVAGMVPRAELEGDYGDSHVGLQARLMSQGMRKINSIMQANESDVILVWINQIRDKIGVMGYGPQTTTTGGRALKFWCSTRIDVAKVGQVKQGEEVIGHSVRAKIVKNRYAPPFRSANFDILYDSGISNESTLLDLAIAKGIIKKSGAWFADAETGENLGQGKLKVIELIREDKELYKRLLDTVM